MYRHIHTNLFSSFVVLVQNLAKHLLLGFTNMISFPAEPPTQVCKLFPNLQNVALKVMTPLMVAGTEGSDFLFVEMDAGVGDALKVVASAAPHQEGNLTWWLGSIHANSICPFVRSPKRRTQHVEEIIDKLKLATAASEPHVQGTRNISYKDIEGEFAKLPALPAPPNLTPSESQVNGCNCGRKPSGRPIDRPSDRPSSHRATKPSFEMTSARASARASEQASREPTERVGERRVTWRALGDATRGKDVRSSR